MLRMFSTINGQVERVEKPESGSWLCLSEPTDAELASVASETGIDLADLRAPLEPGAQVGTVTVTDSSGDTRILPLVVPDGAARISTAHLWLQLLRAL